MADGSVTGVTEDAATRLGRLIRERRKSLNLTQADIQTAGGPSTATLRLIEGGKHTDFRPSTSQPLEKALHWAHGSIANILKGGGPSVSGAIRGRSGFIETFNAVDGFEQHNLRRLRLGAIIMDARDLVHSQPGPLMTALASILDEASDLVIKVLAEYDDEDDIADARWRIDQVRAGNSIRRQGDLYVTDVEEDAPTLKTAPPAASRGDSEGQAATKDDQLGDDRGQSSAPSTLDGAANEYDLAARDVGPSEGRRLREEQDRAAETGAMDDTNDDRRGTD